MGNESRLTVLTTLGGVKAVKTLTQREDGKIHVEQYGRAKNFTAESIEVDEEGRWLRRLAKKPHSFVVLGEPKDWKKGEVKRRLSSNRDEADATLIDVPRLWLPVDIDQVDFTPDADIQDGNYFAIECLDRLGIRDAMGVWQFTNSHAIGGKYRMRLWVRLDRPALAEEMKAWARERWGEETVEVNGKEKPIVDLAVYKPAQPIYTGSPICVDMDDPVERRIGTFDGAPLKMKVPKKAKDKKGEAPDDENIAALTEAGLYIKRLRPGQHAILCPWEDEHSGDPRDDDTVYFEPHFGGHDIPAFKCHHDTHRDKHWEDVAVHIGLNTSGFVPVGDDEGEAKDTPAWVFVHRLKQFWDARDGMLVDKESYDYTHGGKTKRGTPTERFIASNKTTKVDAAEFLPGQSRIVRRGKLKVLNTYIDNRVKPDLAGDYATFVEHVAWLVPEESEREHLLDWLSWVYQNPGRKVTWAPILYGPPGTGKTSVFNVLAKCIGVEHVSEPTQAELEDKFTDWAFGKILVKIEELMSGDKFHVAEKLKPIVANPTISVRRMHQTGFTALNVANVCASTNHMAALPIEKGDRRYMMIECCDAPIAERKRHMRAFHQWLGEAGHAGIAAFFDERDLSHFRPESEAPDTRLKALVMEASMTDFDRACDLCDVFDDCDVVTSSALSDYLNENESPVAAKRLGMLAGKRGWHSLPGQQSRTRYQGKKLTLWSPTGKLEDIRSIIAMDTGARSAFLGRLHTQLANPPEKKAKRSRDHLKGV